MAPIQKTMQTFLQHSNSEASTKTSSSSVNSTTYSHTSRDVNKRHAAESGPNKLANYLESRGETDLLLPITSRGKFYHDSFFADLRQDYDRAVSNVLDLWGARTSIHDDLSSYSHMRDTNLTEDTQALTVTQDDTCHKVVIDVRGFMGRDLKVKMVDENELVVEGSVESSQEGSVANKSFCRRFTFPGLVNADTVTSSVSSDGVLTVIVPKKKSSAENVTRNIAITTSNKDAEYKTTESCKTEAKECVHRVSESESSSKLRESRGSQASSKSAQEASPEAHFSLPVCEKGAFFKDSFFQDVQKQFESAMREIVENQQEKKRASDVTTSYRSLRECDLKEGNQAITLTEDQHTHKIVLHIEDFKDGLIKVNIVNNNELVVEGTVDNGGSEKSFCRRVTIPGLSGHEAVTWVMSADGILTVTVKKTKENCKEHIKTNCKSRSNCNTTLTEASKASSVASKCSTEESQQSERVQDASDERVASLGLTFPRDLFLPVSLRGPFSCDSFFQDFRRDFDSAVKEVLERHGALMTNDDTLSCYRNLRSGELSDETRALRTSDDQHSYKVVLDVRDFKEGDVKVKVVDDQHVVVEGRHDTTDNGFSSCRIFRHRFNIPAKVNLEAISSAMSSDGVLTITAPKNSTTAMSSDGVLTVTAPKNGTAAKEAKC